MMGLTKVKSYFEVESHSDSSSYYIDYRLIENERFTFLGMPMHGIMKRNDGYVLVENNGRPANRVVVDKALKMGNINFLLLQQNKHYLRNLLEKMVEDIAHCTTPRRNLH